MAFEPISLVPALLKIFPPLARFVSWAGLKMKDRKIRKTGHLPASERTTRAAQILPQLRGPDATEVLRHHSFKVSDEYLSTLKFANHLLFNQRDVDQVHELQRYERIANPVPRGKYRYWVLDDESIIVESDGEFAVEIDERKWVVEALWQRLNALVSGEDMPDHLPSPDKIRLSVRSLTDGTDGLVVLEVENSDDGSDFRLTLRPAGAERLSRALVDSAQDAIDGRARPRTGFSEGDE